MSGWGEEKPWWEQAASTEGEKSNSDKKTGWDSSPVQASEAPGGWGSPPKPQLPSTSVATSKGASTGWDSSPVAPKEPSPDGWGAMPSPKTSATPLFPTNHTAPPQQSSNGWSSQQSNGWSSQQERPPRAPSSHSSDDGYRSRGRGGSFAPRGGGRGSFRGAPVDPDRPWLKAPVQIEAERPNERAQASLRGNARFKAIDSGYSSDSNAPTSWNAPFNEQSSTEKSSAPSYDDWGVPQKSKPASTSPQVGWGSPSSPKQTTSSWSPVEAPKQAPAKQSTSTWSPVEESKAAPSGWSPQDKPVEAESTPKASQQGSGWGLSPPQPSQQSSGWSPEQKSAPTFDSRPAAAPPASSRSQAAPAQATAPVKTGWSSPEVKAESSPDQGWSNERGRSARPAQPPPAPAYRRRPESLERGWGSSSPEQKQNDSFAPPPQQSSGWTSSSSSQQRQSTGWSPETKPFEMPSSKADDFWSTKHSSNQGWYDSSKTTNGYGEPKNGYNSQTSNSYGQQNNRARHDSSASSQSSGERVNNSARRFASSSYTAPTGRETRPTGETDDWRNRSSDDQLVDPFENQPDFEKLSKLQTLFEQRQADAIVRREARLQAKKEQAAAAQRSRDHPVFRVLKDRRLVSRLYAAMCKVEPDETKLLLRLVLVCRAFHESIGPILFSGIELTSSLACDRLFDSLSNPELGRGKLLMAQLRSLRLVNIEAREAARIFLLLGHQLTDVQLCIIEEEGASDSERARQRGRLVDGLSRCRRLERFAVRQSIIKATQMAMLLALWPRLIHLDLEGAIPAIGDAGIKQALLPRLKHISLHSTAPAAEIEGFLRYFISPSTTLELHESAFAVKEYNFKRLKKISIDSMSSRGVVETLQRGLLPVLKELAVQTGGDGVLADECKRRGVYLSSGGMQ